MQILKFCSFEDDNALDTIELDVDILVLGRVG